MSKKTKSKTRTVCSECGKSRCNHSAFEKTLIFENVITLNKKKRRIKSNDFYSKNNFDCINLPESKLFKELEKLAGKGPMIKVTPINMVDKEKEKLFEEILNWVWEKDIKKLSDKMIYGTKTKK